MKVKEQISERSRWKTGWKGAESASSWSLTVIGRKFGWHGRESFSGSIKTMMAGKYDDRVNCLFHHKSYLLFFLFFKVKSLPVK